MVTTISTDTFIRDLIMFIRDDLETNITDPISAKRTAAENFAHTSYPSRPVKYPIITVKTVNISDTRRMGMQSEQHWTKIILEIRVWARNVVEKDGLAQSVLNRLRANQFSGSGTSTFADVHDFLILSVSDVDEPGEGGIRSKIIQCQYMFVLGS